MRGLAYSRAHSSVWLAVVGCAGGVCAGHHLWLFLPKEDRADDQHRGGAGGGFAVVSRWRSCLRLAVRQLHLAVFDAEVGAVEGEKAPGVVDGLADADADVGHDFVGGGGWLDEAAA